MSRLLCLTLIGIALIYTIESAPMEKIIKGKITHAGESNIDANAQIKVELRDISLMDAPSKLIASTTITDAKKFPVSYTITYNPSDIKGHNSYAVSARITGPGNKLLYISDTNVRPEFTGSKITTADIGVIRVGGSSDTNVNKQGDNKGCSPVKCPGNKPKKCAYGYQKKDGCEICRCNDPCNPPGKAKLCGANQKCHVDKKPDGTFEARCGDSSSKKPAGDKSAICNLPKVTGLCMANMTRYYFNPTTKKCETFVYKGCRGNDNNFTTKAECEKTCKA